MRTCILISVFIAGLAAAEPAATNPTTAIEKPPIAASASPDPTVAVVAEGAFTYRQRDVDALVLIAKRHARGKLSSADIDVLKQVLVRACIAREALLPIIAELPMEPAARDAFVLDLLDYTPSTPTPIPGAAPPAAKDVSAKPAPAPIAAAAVDASKPVIITLPPLTRTRTLPGMGRRQLTLGLAFLLPNAAAANALEAKSALIQDAIQGAVQALDASQFSEPDQVVLKAALTTAIRARVPEFPADALLIPQLDAGADNHADKSTDSSDGKP